MIAGKILKHSNILKRDTLCVISLAFQKIVTCLGSVVVLAHTQNMGEISLWELLMWIHKTCKGSCTHVDIHLHSLNCETRKNQVLTRLLWCPLYLWLLSFLLHLSNLLVSLMLLNNMSVEQSIFLVHCDNFNIHSKFCVFSLMKSCNTAMFHWK